MFEKETVFVLGAGASWHYGYPTGEKLIEQMRANVKRLEAFCVQAADRGSPFRPRYMPGDGNGTDEHYWKAFVREARKLRDGLHHMDPLVIDYFLGWNPSLQELGKLLIGWSLIDCESRSGDHSNWNRKNGSGDTAGKDRWIRFVLHQIIMNCKTSKDLLENRVWFVTFNYDRSLERELREGLQQVEIFEDGDIEEFLEKENRVIHVYGKLRDPSYDFKMRTLNHADLDDARKLLDAIHEMSEGIRVIDPHAKEKDIEVLELAKSAIKFAEHVYILGFGFDQNNCRRLGLNETLYYENARKKSVFFTNFGDINRINKRASQVFFRQQTKFGPADRMIESSDNYYYEKSTRDVYGALAQDFEPFE